MIRIWPFFRRFVMMVAVLLATTIALHQAILATQQQQHSRAGVLQNKAEGAKETPEPTQFIPDSCKCTDAVSGINHNFCYQLSADVYGKKFDCSFLPLLKELGLLDTDIFKFGDGEKFPEPMFVTGSSEGHLSEQLRAISTLQEMFPTQNMVFYDLGLSTKSAENMASYCNVQYRKFPFERYPSYVKSLMQYRWKPLIIAEALKEFGAIWWFDSSVVWKKNNLSHIYDLVKCKYPRDQAAPPATQATPDPKWVAAGWDKDKWRMSVWRCDKFPYMLQGFTGHGIFSATNPGVFKYIPSEMDRLKQESAKMYEAGFLFAVRTPEVIGAVVKWYVLCALEKDCMAPAEARLGCRFHKVDKYGVYANCHRFDQSVVNLLLANKNHYHSYYYTSGIVDFFKIIRGGDNRHPKTCPT